MTTMTESKLEAVKIPLLMRIFGGHRYRTAFEFVKSRYEDWVFSRESDIPNRFSGTVRVPTSQESLLRKHPLSEIYSSVCFPDCLLQIGEPNEFHYTLSEYWRLLSDPELHALRVQHRFNFLSPTQTSDAKVHYLKDESQLIRSMAKELYDAAY